MDYLMQWMSAPFISIGIHNIPWQRTVLMLPAAATLFYQQLSILVGSR